MFHRRYILGRIDPSERDGGGLAIVAGVVVVTVLLGLVFMLVIRTQPSTAKPEPAQRPSPTA